VGVFVIFFTGSVMHLRNGDLAGGNVFLLFSGFFIAMNIAGLLAKYFSIKAGVDFGAAAAAVDKWGWLGAVTFLVLCTPAFLKAPKMFLGLVVIIDVALVTLCLNNFGMVNPAVGSKITGSFLMVAGWLSLYLAGGITCNTALGKSLFPIV
jgi:uncharacterized protein